MTDSQKKHLRSAFITFLTTFFILICTDLKNKSDITWTLNMEWGVVWVAFRGAFKVAAESWLGSNDQ